MIMKDFQKFRDCIMKANIIKKNNTLLKKKESISDRKPRPPIISLHMCWCVLS